jgi:hypothetical protein
MREGRLHATPPSQETGEVRNLVLSVLGSGFALQNLNLKVAVTDPETTKRDSLQLPRVMELRRK